MKDKIVISDEEHGFRFLVPHKSPKGEEVRVHLGERDGTHRVHVMTEDRHEIYFEVRSYPEIIDHREAIARHKEFIAKQFDRAILGKTEADEFGGRTGTTFSFTSKNFGRRFLFVDTNERTYSIVYDHQHPYNETMLDGFEIVTQSRKS